MLNVVLQDIELDRTGVIGIGKNIVAQCCVMRNSIFCRSLIFSPLEPISNVGLYGTYTIYKGLSFKKHKPIGVFTDQAIVLSVLMLSFIFGIGFRGLKWKRIYVVFCSFYFSVTTGVRIADIGGIRTANSSGAPPVLLEFVLFFSFMFSML
jgi:hypothetical protein